MYGSDRVLKMAQRKPQETSGVKRLVGGGVWPISSDQVVQQVPPTESDKAEISSSPRKRTTSYFSTPSFQLQKVRP
jgi:hypothetical protein